MVRVRPAAEVTVVDAIGAGTIVFRPSSSLMFVYEGRAEYAEAYAATVTEVIPEVATKRTTPIVAVRGKVAIEVVSEVGPIV